MLGPLRLSVCLEDRLDAAFIAVWAYGMRGSALCFRRLKDVGERALSPALQLVALLLSVPCFKAHQFCFKLAYAFNQRRMRRLCGEDFFGQFYGHRIANGDVVCILQSLRQIEKGLEDAEASQEFSSHRRLLSVEEGARRLTGRPNQNK